MTDFDPAKPVNNFKDIEVIVSPFYVGEPNVLENGDLMLSVQFMHAQDLKNGCWESEIVQRFIGVTLGEPVEKGDLTPGFTLKSRLWKGVGREKKVASSIHAIFQDFAGFQERMKEKGYKLSWRTANYTLGTPLGRARELYKPLSLH